MTFIFFDLLSQLNKRRMSLCGDFMQHIINDDITFLNLFKFFDLFNGLTGSPIYFHHLFFGLYFPLLLDVCFWSSHIRINLLIQSLYNYKD